MASVSAIAANARNAIVRFFRRLIGYASGPGHRNNDPNERLDELERWSARATLWILFGILAEIVLIWVPLPNIWQKVGETSANALIGIGLIVEYFVIGRAIIATGKAKQLSDQQVAEANARAEGDYRSDITIHRDSVHSSNAAGTRADGTNGASV